MSVVSKLALNGGPRTVPAGAVKPWPHVSDADRAAVMEVVAGENINEQRTHQNRALTEEFAAYLGVRHCIPTNSGTSALHMAIAALGIEPGDEVLVPAFTFWASAAAVLHHNAIPVFVDIDPVTHCIDPRRIEERITPRTKAIMPVHIHGLCADMDPINELAARHGLKVIEDAAQAAGARYKGRLAGTLGDAAAFSLQVSKVLTSGSEGGLFVTDDDSVRHRAALVQYFGESVETGSERAAQEYNAYGVGWMYRGDVFGQAFARSQLRRLDELNRARIENCEYLTGLIADIPGVSGPAFPTDRHHVYYNYVIRFDPTELGLDVSARWLRERVQRALIAEGVHAGQWQRVPVPAQEIFQQRAGYGKGCPWRCWNSSVEYRAEDYPSTLEFLDAHCYLFDTNYPNDRGLMDLYAEALSKVLTNIHEVREPDLGAEDRMFAERYPWEIIEEPAGSTASATPGTGA
jgi:perosamine synthetase